MYKIIDEIQNGCFVNFDLLLEKFRPLIFSWLIQSKQIASNQREDLISDAKVILLECALSYDKTKSVPFESYYKISLYHWYSNKYRKKQIHTVELSDQEEALSTDVESRVEKVLVIQLVQQFVCSMNADDQKLINLTLAGYGPKEISMITGRKYKNVRNRKANIMKKLRKEMINAGIDLARVCDL